MCSQTASSHAITSVARRWTSSVRTRAALRQPSHPLRLPPRRLSKSARRQRSASPATQTPRPARWPTRTPRPSPRTPPPPQPQPQTSRTRIALLTALPLPMPMQTPRALACSPHQLRRRAASSPATSRYCANSLLSLSNRRRYLFVVSIRCIRAIVRVDDLYFVCSICTALCGHVDLFIIISESFY